MSEILAQVNSLDIPYPQRHLLTLEIQQDLEFASASERARFTEQDLAELRAIHSTQLHLFLSRFSGDIRKRIESILSLVPLFIVIAFTIKEDVMIEFIREGGAGMYAILAVGLFLLGNEAVSAFRLFVVKNHSGENLKIDSWSVLLGCSGLMFLGLGWTGFGLYLTANAVTESHLSYDLLVVGAKESMTPLILSSLLASIIVLAHYGTRRTLEIWRAPLNS